MPLLPRYTILPSHFVLPHLGSANTTLQSSHKRLGLSMGFQLNGGHAPAQFPSVMAHSHLHNGKTPLPLVHLPSSLLSSVQSQVSRWLFFLGILVQSILLPSHQMGCCLYLEVMTALSNCGMYRLVGSSKPSVVTPDGLPLFPSQQIVPQLFQGLMMRQFVCGTFRQGSAFAS